MHARVTKQETTTTTEKTTTTTGEDNHHDGEDNHHDGEDNHYHPPPPSPLHYRAARHANNMRLQHASRHGANLRQLSSIAFAYFTAHQRLQAVDFPVLGRESLCVSNEQKHHQSVVNAPHTHTDRDRDRDSERARQRQRDRTRTSWCADCSRRSCATTALLPISSFLRRSLFSFSRPTMRFSSRVFSAKYDFSCLLN